MIAKVTMNKTLKPFSMLKKNKWLTTILTLCALAMIFHAGQKLFLDCEYLPAFDSPWFAAAIVLACVYRIINAYGWALVLRAMKQPVDGTMAIKIWLRAESRRWLPGGVWGYASRAVQAQELKVSPSVASASMLVELLLTMVAALIVAVPAVLIYQAEFLTSLNQYLLSATSALPVILVAVVCVALAAVFHRKIVRKFQSLSNRFQDLRGLSISVRGTATALLFFILMGILNGGVTVLLLWSLPVETVPPTVLIAATSWAWVVGFLAIFSPGGLFVREGIFALCLAVWLPYGTGITLAILARLLQMFAEFLGVVCVSIDWRSIIAKRLKLIQPLD